MTKAAKKTFLFLNSHTPSLGYVAKTSPPAEAFGDTDDCFTNMEPSLVKIGVNYMYV